MWPFRKTEKVILVGVSRRFLVSARKLGRDWWAAPYLPDTICQLLPGGKIGSGECYISGWHPVTPGMVELYDSTPPQPPAEA